MSMSDRADTKAKREAVLRRISEAWERVPTQRLGQLLGNACHPGDVFVVEDIILADAVEAFAYPRTQKAEG